MRVRGKEDEEVVASMAKLREDLSMNDRQSDSLKLATKVPTTILQLYQQQRFRYRNSCNHQKNRPTCSKLSLREQYPVCRSNSRLEYLKETHFTRTKGHYSRTNPASTRDRSAGGRSLSNFTNRIGHSGSSRYLHWNGSACTTPGRRKEGSRQSELTG